MRSSSVCQVMKKVNILAKDSETDAYAYIYRLNWMNTTAAFLE